MDTMGFDAVEEKKKVKARGNIFKRIKMASQDSKDLKKVEGVIKSIDKLLDNSGVKNEITDNKDNEIADLIKQNLGED